MEAPLTNHRPIILNQGTEYIMSKLIALPSPNGTNHEKLFLTITNADGSRFRNPQGAYDSNRRRYARDEYENGSLIDPDIVKKIIAHCRDAGLSEDVIGQLATLMSGGTLDGDEPLDRVNLPSDEPPPFEGRPSPGGKLVGDRALARRVRRSLAEDAVRTGKDFAERFPSADRIGFG
jgi:hypothetical protein